MDEYQMTEEQENAVLRLSAVIAENNRREAEAVQGYTEQLQAINDAKRAFSDVPEVTEALSAIEAETREKIADELSHSRSLNAEYAELTDIAPKED